MVLMIDGQRKYDYANRNSYVNIVFLYNIVDSVRMLNNNSKTNYLTGRVEKFNYNVFPKTFVP